MKKYDLVMFDLDGTLADTFPWFLTVLNDVADRYRFKRVQPEEVDEFRLLNARQIMARLELPGWKLPFIAGYMRRLAGQNMHQIPLFEGVHEMLAELKGQGVMIAVVSSNGPENIRKLLGPSMTHVSWVEGGASLFGKAPRFRKVMAQAGVPPHRALAVGDEIRDVDSAKKAGVPFGAVSWGMTHLDALRLHSPAEAFEELGDVVKAVCGRT